MYAYTVNNVAILERKQFFTQLKFVAITCVYSHIFFTVNYLYYH